MKNMGRFGQPDAGFALAAILAVLMATAGCESDKKTDSVDGYFNDNPYASLERQPPSDAALTISPSEAGGTRVGQKINFKAAGGATPYTWHVADPAYGTLTVKGWSEAVYTVAKVGDNEVIVTDQRSHAAIARVMGAVPALTAVAVPATLQNDGDKSVLTASGGQPPYQWTVLDAALGHLVGNAAGASVAYMRDHNGDNVVRVQDADGAVFKVRIEQP